MLDFGASDFVGFFFSIGLFAFLTSVMWWGFWQITSYFFHEEDEDDKKNFFHHHFHYKAK